MNDVITVVSAERYHYVKQDGSVSEGVTIQWFSGNSMEPYVKRGDENKKGRHVVDDRLLYEDWEQIKSVPGIYEAELEMTEVRGAYGPINKLAVINLSFISDCMKGLPGTVKDIK